MNLIPVIIDSEVGYTVGSAEHSSLLCLPLGAGTVLDHLASQVGRVGQVEILVIGASGTEHFGQLELSAPVALPIRFVQREDFSRELDRYEASDYVLIVDPRFWPVGGYELERAVRRLHGYQGATHTIALGASIEGANERVECDSNGSVKRVQRLYSVKSWSELTQCTIPYSIAPARAAAGFSFGSPMELRAALSATGVLSQDVPLRFDTLALHQEGGFLALMERTVSDLCRQPPPEGYELFRPEVLAGRGCSIHPSVRIVGPVLIQPRVAIEEGVTIIGPAVLGAGTQILRGATVAQSALAADSIVSAESVVRQRVVVDRCTQDQLDSTAQDCSPVASVLPSSRAGSNEAVGASVWSPRVRRVNLVLKRAMDIVLSAAALLALWPLLVLVAIIVKLDSRGPVLFAHHREGRRGRDFPCWKFRTMVAHANQIQRQLYKHNEVDGPQFKMKNDPRITRVGRWLRGTNIDELPQLLNVLLGHMSLVGPRPSPFRENQICVPWRRARLSVRPGITGLWQVCRDEDRLKGDFHEWIFYDMTYVRHLSVWLDIKILLATLFTLGGRWSVPLAWVLPGATPARDQHPYSVSAA